STESAPAHCRPAPGSRRCVTAGQLGVAANTVARATASGIGGDRRNAG
ncbi:LOW QUALITY PROTEIN: transcriptional regulatory protein, partial [Mycobacterium tuberculosis T85]